jgi:hypothetical protein
MCREKPPTLPWAGLASRAERTTVMAGRPPSHVGFLLGGRVPLKAAAAGRPCAGSMLVATSLSLVRPGAPPGPTPRSQGIASTAVCPLY